jgi:hypothetical protein
MFTFQVEFAFDPRDFWIGVCIGESFASGYYSVLPVAICIIPMFTIMFYFERPLL